jgi:hypothetical protein
MTRFAGCDAVCSQRGTAIVCVDAGSPGKEVWNRVLSIEQAFAVLSTQIDPFLYLGRRKFFDATMQYNKPAEATANRHHALQGGRPAW